MAEAWLRHLAADRFDVFSAGLAPKPIHPLTVQVLQERGVSTSGQWPKPVSEYMGRRGFDYVIFVCTEADSTCPHTFPGATVRWFWPFPDPAAVTGTPEEQLAAFRSVRDGIERRIRAMLEVVNTSPCCAPGTPCPSDPPEA